MKFEGSSGKTNLLYVKLPHLTSVYMSPLYHQMRAFKKKHALNSGQVKIFLNISVLSRQKYKCYEKSSEFRSCERNLCRYFFIEFFVCKGLVLRRSTKIIFLTFILIYISV